MKVFKIVEDYVDYHINEDKGIVVAELRCFMVPRCAEQIDLTKDCINMGGQRIKESNDLCSFICTSFVCKGKATCSKEDVFDVEKGKRIAYIKAKKNLMNECAALCGQFAKQFQSLYLDSLNEMARYKNAAKSEIRELDYACK